MKLTKENVNQLFSECEWKVDEWPKEVTSIEEAPDVAQMLIPLSNGVNIAGFYPDKIVAYSDTISELLDQIPYLSEKTGISFPMLGRSKNGSWSEDIYEIQKLYLLGVVSDQLLALPVNGRVVIGRIPKEKGVVDIVSIGENGKTKLLAKKLGDNYYKPNH